MLGYRFRRKFVSVSLQVQVADAQHRPSHLLTHTADPPDPLTHNFGPRLRPSDQVSSAWTSTSCETSSFVFYVIQKSAVASPSSQSAKLSIVVNWIASLLTVMRYTNDRWRQMWRYRKCSGTEVCARKWKRRSWRKLSKRQKLTDEISKLWERSANEVCDQWKLDPENSKSLKRERQLLRNKKEEERYVNIQQDELIARQRT